MVGYMHIPLHPEEKAAILIENGTLWSAYPWLLLCKRENLLSLPEKEIGMLDFPTYSLMLDALCYHGTNLVQNPTQQNSTA
jgi:hypothetical protein